MGILGGAGGTGVRIATASDRSRRNSRVIPRPVRRLVVGSEPSAASGRGSEVSEWPRSKFPASAVRQRRNFGHRNRDIRNTPAQIQRGTDCHSQCAHWLRNDTLQGVRRAGRRGRRPLRGVTRGAMGGRPQGSPLRKRYMGCGRRAVGDAGPYGGLQEARWAGDRKGRPYERLQEVPACGGGLLRCIRGAFCSARRYYGPPGPRFGPGRDRP